MRRLSLILALGIVCAVSPVSAQEEEPLLLLEDEPEANPSETGGVDNSRCHVCHLNFAMEEIAVTHARQNIGCDECHGNCDDHIDDESWAEGGPGTPPGIMYPRNAIVASCTPCHHSHDAPARTVLMRWRERAPEIADPKEIVCTDCHGKHRVKSELRHAWWDKETGKPIKP